MPTLLPNHPASPAPSYGPAETSAAARGESPFVLALRLSATLHARVPLVKLSSSLLLQWLQEGLHWLRSKAQAVDAIDDELERRGDLIARALANDPPELRAEVNALLTRLRARVAQESRTLAAARDIPETH